MSQLPAVLERGDVVRLVAPSGAFDRAAFETGVGVLEQAGFRPVFDEAIFERHHYFAGTDSRRQHELDRALADPEARCIWMARGGYGATRLVAGVDPAVIARGRKWFVGFSDGTALHAAWARAGVASLHGANVTTLGLWSDAARAELFGALVGERAPHFFGRTVKAGPTVRGPLHGGNLTVLAAMSGTGHLPSFAGSIMLIEDIGERPYRLDRSLTQLCLAGAFRGVLGFVIGQLTDCVEAPGKPESDYSALEAVADVLKPLGHPIVGELPIGHDASSRPVLLGVDWVLDPGRSTLTMA
jgi:muramoyltetrapeptide carboxypeptidase